ncbi:Inhibitory POU protein [Eufriesea mexicana]|nr:Inhibitory POU protein [Eufriesea mexicana]
MRGTSSTTLNGAISNAGSPIIRSLCYNDKSRRKRQVIAARGGLMETEYLGVFERVQNGRIELNIEDGIADSNCSFECKDRVDRGDLFGGLNSGLQDGLLSRAEALAADLGKHNAGTPMPLKHDPVSVYHHGAHMPTPHPNNRPHHQMSHPGMESLDMLDPANSMTTLTPMSENTGGGPGHHAGIHGPSVYGGMNGMMGHHHHHGNLGGGGGSVPHPAHHHPAMAAAAAAAAAAGLHPDADTDPRELEAFAERFKQRRIKLGVTQADVGKALANLKLPGVGALSQSTICRFESLTLSHNNMIALKPILQAWLEEAEAQAKNKRRDPDAPSVLPAGEKKRKRTSIAAPEKRSLEAYFAVQPRPSGEKIAAIAEKLDLKKNVVRVWFCNQRQKQKRMKFAAQH